MQFVIEKLSHESAFHRELVYGSLRELKLDFYRNYYPKVEHWYDDKLIDGFADSSRIVHVVRSSSLLYGMSIIRVSPEKTWNKLCTFFLLPEARGNGAGSALMNLTLRELQRQSPAKPTLVTVPEERMNEKVNGKTFSNFLGEFGFSLIASEPNRYRLGKVEYVCSKAAVPSVVQAPLPNLPLIEGRYPPVGTYTFMGTLSKSFDLATR